MVTYVLILFFHVGAMCSGNSNATAAVPGFTVQQECEAAGNAAKRLTSGTCKDVTFVCVKQTVSK